MGDNSKPTQVERIVSWMREHGSITAKEAMDLGVWRLASRISEIKKDGYLVAREFVEVENRYGEKCRIARYRLVEV